MRGLLSNMTNIHIGNKEYKVQEAHTEEEKEKGLQGVSSLPEDQGMLFFFEEPQEVSMWMKDTLIPLDIIFINEDNEVVKVAQGEPNDETPIIAQDTLYVLEINKNSGVKEGDELEIQTEGPVMKVLAQDGSSQMDLWGGERIVSRRETKILIKKAIKAQQTNQDSDYKTLGRYIFKVIKKQDTREPEYVASPT